MPLTTTKDMFEKAYGKYAVGAFNVNNMEILQGVIEAAKEEKSPLILQISKGARNYAKIIYLMKLIEAATIDAPEVPIAVHLDHGDSFELCKEVIDSGFTSVMIDGSHLPFEENIALTRQVVDYAHPGGVVVEGELGKLMGIEEHVVSAEAVYTDPEKAVEFVERTGVDSLAIAIGTSHGAYKFKGEAHLDFDRLREISRRLPKFPLVLHGASSVLPELVKKANMYGANLGNAKGVPVEMIRKATSMGICKVNIDTDLRLAVTSAIREQFVLNPSEFDPRKYLGPARDSVKEVVKHKMREVLGSSNQA